MIGANSPASLRFRDPIEAALEEIEIDRKNVPKYISVGAYSEQVIEKEQISAADERDIIEAASTNTVNEVIHPFYYKLFINGY